MAAGGRARLGTMIVGSVLVASAAAFAPPVAASAGVPVARDVAVSAAPAPASRLRAVVSPAGLGLEWAPSATPSAASSVLRLARGTTPPTRDDGSAVAVPSGATDVQLPDLAPGTRYAASLWTRDTAGLWSSRTTTTFVTDSASTAAAVTGVITDREQHPLAGAVVYAFNLDLGTTHVSAPTGAAGRYRLPLPAGQYFVDVDGSSATGGNSDTTGYVATGDTATATAAATRVQDFALGAGGAVRGRITDTQGRPLAGVSPYVQPTGVYVEATSTSDFFDILDSFFVNSIYSETSSDGRYEIRGVPPGVYEGCADPSEGPVRGGRSGVLGYVGRCSAPSYIVRAHARTVAADLALPASTGGALAGIVTGASGRPLAGAELDLEPIGNPFFGGYATSGADGSYYQAGLAPGRYRVCASAGFSGDSSSKTGSAPRCSAPVFVRSGRITTSNVALPVGAAISGTVRATSGQPIAGVEVEVNRKHVNGAYGYASTDAHGHYLVTGLATGSYRVCFDPSAVAPSPRTPTGVLRRCYRNGAGVVATRGTTRTRTDGVLPPAGAISGRVTDSKGAPIAYADIDLPSRDLFGSSNSTDRDGRFTVADLPADDYRICAHVPSLDGSDRTACASKSVAVTQGRTTRHVTLTLPDGGQVDVHLSDKDGRPVAGVNEALVRACKRADNFCETVPVVSTTRDVFIAASATTDGSGAVDFGYVPPGTYAACAFAFRGATAAGALTTGYADRCTDTTFTIAVTTGHTATVHQTLAPGGVLSGRVTDPDGHPLEGVRVHVPGSPADDYDSSFGFTFGDGSDPVSASTTAADGTFTIGGVRPGSPTVCFDAFDATGGTSAGGYFDRCLGMPITITSGQETPVGNNVLDAGGAISGVLESTDGTRVSNADVEVFTTNGAFVTDAFVEGLGKYSVDRLHTGSYVVCFDAYQYKAQCYDKIAWSGGRLPAGTTPVPVTAGQATPDIDAVLVKR